uniref:Uncharacterized protein n=1 Tax=Oryza rufipogon TaxID=4529 RepID=A0A0E0QGD7_ORYRU
MNSARFRRFTGELEHRLPEQSIVSSSPPLIKRLAAELELMHGHQRDMWTQQDLMMMMMGQKYHPRMRTYRMLLYSAIVMALV